MTFCAWAKSFPEVFWFCLFVSETDTLFFFLRGFIAVASVVALECVPLHRFLFPCYDKAPRARQLEKEGVIRLTALEGEHWVIAGKNGSK